MPALLASEPCGSGVVDVWMTDRYDGDFNADLIDHAELKQRQSRLSPSPWAMLDEQHGADVVVVDAAIPPWDTVGDALVHNGQTGAAATLAVWVGDCAPVALIGDNGWFGVAHAGWRGVVRGVLGQTVTTLRSTGADAVHAVLGPCIHACCYEFSAPEINTVACALGCDIDEIRTTAASGASSLDMVRAVILTLDRCGVSTSVMSECTACSGRFWSYRREGDRSRQAMYAFWRNG